MKIARYVETFIYVGMFNTMNFAYYQKGEKFSLAQIVKSLWSYISTRRDSNHSDYFSTHPNDNLMKIFGSERISFSEVKKSIQHHVYHGGKSIYNGYEIGGWQCKYFDISFDNLS